jgi:Fic family protein
MNKQGRNEYVDIIFERLIWESKNKQKGGLYHKSQVSFAYNSNRIEGSTLTQEETEQIFETKQLLLNSEEAKPVNDIIETVNHFRVFDFVLETVESKLTSDLIKKYHKKLKEGIIIDNPSYQVIGSWKKFPNVVGGEEKMPPKKVSQEIESLLIWEQGQDMSSINKLAEFHYRFEEIHPFYDGNGRVGRLILFKQCLQYGIDPFIILNNQKAFYYRGLRQFDNEKGFLIGTFETSQDAYKKTAKYFLGI